MSYLNDFEEEQEDQDSGDPVISAVVAAATDSTLLGAVVGGSIVGAIVGDALDGDLMD